MPTLTVLDWSVEGFIAEEFGVEFGHVPFIDVEFDANDMSGFRVGGLGKFKDV